MWGKPCLFQLMSMPSKYKGQITCSRPFFNEPEGNHIHTSEFYPQSLREKTMPIGYPKITTVQASLGMGFFAKINTSFDEFNEKSLFHLKSIWL